MSFLLKQYADSSYEIQKKAYNFVLIAFFVLLLQLTVITAEMLLGFPFLIILPIVVAAFVLFLIFVIFYYGYYTVASFLFVFIMFLTISFTIAIDVYETAFDLYRYTVAVTMIILVSGVLSLHRRSVLLMTLLGELGILGFYLYRFVFQLDMGSDNVVLISLLVSMLFYGFFGIMATLTLHTTKVAIDIAEKRKNDAVLERDKSVKMLDTLSLYTKPSLIQKVIEGLDPTRIAPEKKQLSVLFCDLRDFTQMTEHLEPKKVIELLNPYFTNMTSIIMSHNGEVDKLIGDGIMAIFDSVADAVTAAVNMRQSLEETALDQEMELKSGIGIHAGEVVVGNIGSPWKMDNTVIGEVVNISSRLEALSKIYRASVIISEKVYKEIEQKELFMLLDKILVKGSSHPINIYGYFDSFSIFDNFVCKERQIDIAVAYAYYLDGNFYEALKYYTDIIKKTKIDYSYKGSYISLMRRRCLTLYEKQKKGLLGDWEGVSSIGKN